MFAVAASRAAGVTTTAEEGPMFTVFYTWMAATGGVLAALAAVGAAVYFYFPHSIFSHTLDRLIGEPRAVRLLHLPNTTSPKLFITAEYTGLTKDQCDQLFIDIDRVIGFVDEAHGHEPHLEHTWPQSMPTATQRSSFGWCLTLPRELRDRLEHHLWMLAQDRHPNVVITLHEARPAGIHPPRRRTP